MSRPPHDPLDIPDDLLAPEDPGDPPASPEPPPSILPELPEDAPEIDDLTLEEPPASPWEDDPFADLPVESDEIELPGDVLEDVDSDEEPTEEPWPDSPAHSDEWVEDEEVGLSEAEWLALEDERSLRAPGRVLVGHKEFVSLPELGLLDQIARVDTGRTRSIIHGERLAPDRARIEGREVSGVAAEDGGLVLTTTLHLGSVVRRVALRLLEGHAEIPIVLGVDALEGYFVVDVALRFLHPRRA